MSWIVRLRVWLASVLAVPPGKTGDGLTPMGGSLYEMLDKGWGEQSQELLDVREAWRKNPLARRIVSLVTAYVIGNGVAVTSNYKPLKRFLSEWWQENAMDLRVSEWCDELTRSGELFVVLYPNRVSGMSQVRLRPAAVIDEIEVNPEDYEDEWRYHDASLGFVDQENAWWLGAGRAQAGQPVMLHYAINRPVGSLRGESDLAPIVQWMRRYSSWLEDRVRLNAGVRAFLWVVSAPGRLHAALRERYAAPPAPGTVVIADEGETWTAVSPNLHANDASNDGRAIRWMITAGGPGTSLLDFGEGEDSNLATGQVMTEMRRRFLRRRQAYMAWLLSDVVVHAWSIYAGVNGTPHRQVRRADVVVEMPDISVEDNQALAGAASELADALTTMTGVVGSGAALRRVALRWFVKFLGEELTEQEFEAILNEGVRQDGQDGKEKGVDVAYNAGRRTVEWRVAAAAGESDERGGD